MGQSGEAKPKTIRLRLAPEGMAALDEMRGIATRILADRPDYEGALELMLKFYRGVEQHERERVENGLRRGPAGGPRLSFPSRPP